MEDEVVEELRHAPVTQRVTEDVLRVSALVAVILVQQTVVRVLLLLALTP